MTQQELKKITKQELANKLAAEKEENQGLRNINYDLREHIKKLERQLSEAKDAKNGIKRIEDSIMVFTSVLYPSKETGRTPYGETMFEQEDCEITRFLKYISEICYKSTIDETKRGFMR